MDLRILLKTKINLSLVAVNNGNGPILPTEQTVKDKTYAPLSRPLFIYVSKKDTARKEVTEFVKFYLANTKTLTKDVGYISLTGGFENIQ